MEENQRYELLEGRLQVYKRDDTRYWQCSASVGGRQWRVSTKEENYPQAKLYAEDWYFGLRGKHNAGLLDVGDVHREIADQNRAGRRASEIKQNGATLARRASRTSKTFREAQEQFMLEFEVLTTGQRSAHYVQAHKDRLRVHLVPFFGDMLLSDITAGKIQEYRVQRAQSLKNGKAPSRSTLHQEMVALRQVLKTGLRHGWLHGLPDMSAPYKSSGKITHRGWFSPDEYKLLYEATGRRAKEPLNNRHAWACEQLHDYVLFMANTGLRPDEAARLEYRDVSVVKDADTKEIILEIEVRGKRGVGWCKSTKGAVVPFQRMEKRNKPEPNERLFPTKNHHRDLLNTILDELELKTDREGNRRTAYSLRHTYICFRLMEGADIYQIAKNCRTSVEMIEKYYASHLKNVLDAAAINVRKGTIRRERKRKKRKG